jgi:hypothetical protein
VAGVLDTNLETAAVSFAKDRDRLRRPVLERVRDERRERLGEPGAIAGDPASGPTLHVQSIPRDVSNDRGDPLVELEALVGRRFDEKEFSSAVEEVEGAGELRPRDIERIAGVIAPRKAPARAFQMERNRRERSGEIVEEGAEELLLRGIPGMD